MVALDRRRGQHDQTFRRDSQLGPEFGARMRASFDNDLAASQQITLEEWEHRPIDARVKELFGRIWEYWL